MTQDKRTDAAELIMKFYALPKRYANRVLVVEFFNDEGFKAMEPEIAKIFDCVVGASVEDNLKLEGLYWLKVAGENELAEQLLAIPKNARVRALAKTKYGICSNPIYTSDEIITRKEMILGLKITRILNVTTPQNLGE